MNMETRQVTQIKIWALRLNTFGKTEEGRIVAAATSEEALKKWYEAQFLEQPESDDHWHYTFKKDSPIRWNNPLYEWRPAREDSFGHGYWYEWINEGSLNPKIHHVDF